MIAKLEKVENSEAYLEIEIAPEVFDQGLEKAYQKAVKKLDIPGFRKGTAPRAIVEANYGVEAFLPDAMDLVVPDAYYAAIKELKLNPIGEPDIEVGYVIKGEPVVVKAIVPLRPEVVLGSLEGLEVSVPPVDPVGEKEIDKYLQDLCQRHQTVIEKKGEPASLGDTVTIDYKGFVEGTVFQGEENFKILLGVDAFIPGFEEQLIGSRQGDHLEVRLKFPATHPAPTLAGKKAIFNVKVNKVETIITRNLDDAFAREVAQVSNLEELRSEAGSKLLKMNERRALEMTRQAVISAALDRCDFTVPESLVMERARFMLEQFSQQLVSQGGSVDLYLQMTNSNEDTLKMKIWKDAKQAIRIEFLLDKIIAEKGFEVSETEISQGIEAFALKIGMDTRNAKENIGPMFANIVYEIKAEKAIQYLLNHAVIKKEDQSEATRFENKPGGETVS